MHKKVIEQSPANMTFYLVPRIDRDVFHVKETRQIISTLRFQVFY